MGVINVWKNTIFVKDYLLQIFNLLFGNFISVRINICAARLRIRIFFILRAWTILFNLIFILITLTLTLIFIFFLILWLLLFLTEIEIDYYSQIDLQLLESTFIFGWLITCTQVLMNFIIIWWADCGVVLVCPFLFGCSGLFTSLHFL
jgi:hypothetical protein